MNQPIGEHRVRRDVVTTHATRGPDHRRPKPAWWWGLGAAAVGVTALSPLTRIGAIQRDLEGKVEAAAQSRGFSVEADFSGQTGTIRCAGPIDEGGVSAIAEAIKGVRGEARFDDATCSVPAIEPTPVTAPVTAPPATTPATQPAVTEAVAPVSQLNAQAVLARDAAGVVLSGVVDTEGDRDRLVAAATEAFGDGNVTDELTIAGVDGAGAAEHVAGLAALIGGMPDNIVEGEAGFDGASLYIRGLYGDADGKDNLDAAIEVAGVDEPNVDLALDTTSAPPTISSTFSSEAELDAAGKMTLRGVVPNEEARAALVEAAAGRVGAENVINELTVASPEADDDPAVARLATLIGAMPPNLYIGTAGWDGGKFYASGQYLSEEQKQDFEEVAVNVGVAVTDLAVEPRPAATADDAAELEKALNDLVALAPIPFEPGSSSFTAEADPILDQVTAVAKRFAGVTIAVNGHTDADGSDAANQELSDARANRVRDALIERGVPAEQLTAQGFGETDPIAPNDTPDNKAKNRRVVFAVVKQ